MKLVKLLLFISCVILATNCSKNMRKKWEVGSAGGAAGSCTGFALQGNTLSAQCKNAVGTPVAASIDLNTCMQNKNGEFADGGGYATSCRDVRIDGTNIVGTCKQADGKTDRPASVAISTVFGNFNGVLKCRRATSARVMMSIA